MGNLRPIGSEKLEGADKIKRIIEISNYKLNTPKPINETASNEYKKTLADGNTYHIVKEKNGYIIKKGLNESVADYIEPMRNRKYYKSYSEAFKRLNLITKEINLNEGYTEHISLFEDDSEVKYFLKGETTEQAQPQAQQQQQLPMPTAPTPAPAPAPDATMPEEPMIEPEMGMDEPAPEPMDMGDEGEDEVVTFKTIQKATGKLAQKIRMFYENEENQMTSQDVKYVINSVLSALDLDLLDEEDKDEIMNKFEGGNEIEYDVELDTEAPGEEIDMGMDEPMSEPGMEEPMPNEMGEMTEFDYYPRHGKNQKDKYVSKVEEMIEGLFESKVDKVLSKYIESKKNPNLEKLKKLVETKEQKNVSLTMLDKNYKLLGKSASGDLIFESKNRIFTVNKKGIIK